MISAVIFDLDGTLVNSTEANFLAYKEAFAAHGIILEKPVYYRHAGKPWQDWGPQIAGSRSIVIHKKKQQLYSSFLHLIEPIQEYTVLLEAFKNTHKTFLVTNASRECAIPVMRKFSLSFTASLYAEDCRNRAAALTAIIGRFQVKPEETLVIDDNRDNLIVAENLGFKTHHAACVTPMKDKHK